MWNSEGEDTSTLDGLDNEKPIPMPRKVPQTNSANNQESRCAIYENVDIGSKPKTEGETPLRRSSNSFQKIERSIRKIIPRRKSAISDSSPNLNIDNNSQTKSLSHDTIFDKISFGSPFENTPAKTSEDASSDYENYYSSESPPPYPPPPLPDESIYDELSSASSYHFSGSDSNSIYEELSKFFSSAAEMPRGPSGSGSSSSNYASVHNNSGSRYEEIEITNEPSLLVPTMTSEGEISRKDKASNTGVGYQVTNTVIMEFDPLASQGAETLSCDEAWNRLCSSSASSLTNPFHDSVIRAFLTDDTDGDDNATYGTVFKKHDSVSSECVKLNFAMPPSTGAPPVPPRRYDSANSEVSASTVVEAIPLSPNAAQPANRTSIIRWSSMKKVARRVAESVENKVKRENVKKVLSEEEVDSSEKLLDTLPPYDPDEIYVPLVLHHSGVLYRSGGGKRWGVLAQRKLTQFASKDSPDVKETIDVDHILSLQLCTENKISIEGEPAFCFELSLAGKSHNILFGTPSSSERHVWMRKILESVTPAFPPKLALDYNKAGRCYFKKNITGKWMLSSVLLSNRSLHIVPKNGSLLTLDLRKARSIVLQDGDLSCMKTSDRRGVLLVDVQDDTVYLQMDTGHETAAWEAAVRAAALNNGPALSQQQLTTSNVPVIVEKTINFVHTHGSSTEGIYRRSGSTSAISRLMTSFRRDAWSTQLSRSEYSEFDVASVLKRFFRDLPEPLFPIEIHPEFRRVVDDKTLLDTQKDLKYRNLLEAMPEINYLTARRLMGHLYFVDKLRAKNLMPVENLAAIWGPTLMHTQEGSQLDPNWSRVESTVVSDLIRRFPSVFDVTEAELQREVKILTILETYHTSSSNTPAVKKPSGDLKVWVYLHSETSDSVSIEATPGKSARDVCQALSSRMESTSQGLCLEEVVCGGLRRILHHSECVLDVVLRWGEWDEEHRRGNCLVVTKATLLYDLNQQFGSVILPIVEELKYADAKTKGFKTFLFELSRTTLCCYKDKSCAVKLREWKVSDVQWWVGHEPKRNPQAGWSITFLTPDVSTIKTKERSFFGHTICGSTELQKRRWMAALLNAQYPDGILPPAVLIE